MKKWWINILAKITPDCRQMTILCSEARDRKLTFVEKIKMHMHGWICTWCIDYDKQINMIGKNIENQGESLADLKTDAMSQECKDRLRSMVEKEKEQ